MAEYIEREALLDRLNKRLKNHAIIGWLCRIIVEVPAADVAPVVHGEWKLVECGTFCTACTRVFDMHFEIPQEICVGLPRCPNCGAKMIWRVK